LGERLDRTQKVAGSSPASSILERKSGRLRRQEVRPPAAAMMNFRSIDAISESVSEIAAGRI
jgi:hypothetical protein